MLSLSNSWGYRPLSLGTDRKFDCYKIRYSPDFKIRQQAKAVNMDLPVGNCVVGRMVNINCISNSNNLLNRLIAVVERKFFFLNF